MYFGKVQMKISQSDVIPYIIFALLCLFAFIFAWLRFIYGLSENVFVPMSSALLAMFILCQSLILFVLNVPDDDEHQLPCKSFLFCSVLIGDVFIWLFVAFTEGKSYLMRNEHNRGEFVTKNLTVSCSKNMQMPHFVNRIGLPVLSEYAIFCMGEMANKWLHFDLLSKSFTGASTSTTHVPVDNELKKEVNSTTSKHIELAESQGKANQADSKLQSNSYDMNIVKAFCYKQGCAVLVCVPIFTVLGLVYLGLQIYFVSESSAIGLVASSIAFHLLLVILSCFGCCNIGCCNSGFYKIDCTNNTKSPITLSNLLTVGNVVFILSYSGIVIYNTLDVGASISVFVNWRLDHKYILLSVLHLVDDLFNLISIHLTLGLLLAIDVINIKYIGKNNVLATIAICITILNIFSWVTDTFLEAKCSSYTLLDTHFYPKVIWDLLMIQVFPLAILFRFHVAMKFSEIYVKIKYGDGGVIKGIDKTETATLSRNGIEEKESETSLN